LFSEYGDFYIMRDTKDSAFLEFFFFDKAKVPEQTTDNFI